MPPGLLASAIAALVLQNPPAMVGVGFGEALGGEDGERLGVLDGAALADADGCALGLAVEGSVLETDELPHPVSISKAAIAIALMCS
jgi:hypothetical protein